MNQMESIKLYQWIVVLLVLSLGCLPQPNDSTGTSHVTASSRHQAEGIELTVEVVPAQLRLSDELMLTVTLRRKSSIQVDMPQFEDALAEFNIRDVRNPLPKLDGPWESVQQVFLLEPTRTGKQTIILPAVNYWTDGSKLNDETSRGATQIIEADPLEIEVTSELSDQSPRLDQLRPENQPVDLPPARSNKLVWIALAVAVFSLLAVSLALILRKRSNAQLRLSPRELARLELQQLVESNWSKIDPKRYFVTLTGIVRRLIESTTGVHAPEQTTPEFLRTIANDPVFDPQVQQRLQEFLESADLVKFAGLQPSDEHIRQSLDHAERFIEADLGSRHDEPRAGSIEEPR